MYSHLGMCLKSKTMLHCLPPDQKFLFFSVNVISVPPLRIPTGKTVSELHQR